MTPTTAEPKRTHRPVDDRVAELEAKIAAIKARDASKQAKALPGAKALLTAVKAVDKAIAVARDVGDECLRIELEFSREPLSKQAAAMGIRLPDSKPKRGRRRKGETA